MPFTEKFTLYESFLLRRSFLLCAVALCFGVGCTVGPNYVTPETSVPDAWESAVVDEMIQEEPPVEIWWESLNDTTLTDLIRRAESANLNLGIAVSRVREARALRGIARGGLLPDVFLDGAYTRTKVSENSQSGQIITGTGGEVAPQNIWNLGFSASWEIDLFGRIRRQIESATAGLEASIEDYRDVLVAVYAEVAINYVDVRMYQTRIAFAQANAASQRESLGLTRDRYNAGLTSNLDVAQAESNLANTEAQIPSLQIGLNAALNRLAVLLGSAPGSLHSELNVSNPIPAPPTALTVGLPVELLRRRPDVRRAERLLASQTAQIGVATADLYPSLSLAGFLELDATDVGNLFSGSSVGWGLVPGVKWNVFNGGKVRNNIKVQEARTEQALIVYEQSVLFALEDVENALVAYERERARRDRLTEAVDASERAVELVRTQYLSGLTNFQNYLDSQRSLFLQQDQLAESEGLVVKNLVFLNKALGGGWPVDEADPDIASGGQ